MNLLYFHATLPRPDRPKEGGVTMFVHRLANQMVRRGHRVTFVSLDPRPDTALYDHRQVNGYQLLQSQMARALLLPLFLHTVPTDEVDVLHAHGDDHWYWPRWLPTVRTFYGSARREAGSAVRLRRRVFQTFLAGCEQLSAHLADVVVSISSDTASLLPRNDLVIPCAVDEAVFHQGAPEERSGFPSILFVGTVGGRKRGGWLVDVFSRSVRPRVPSAQLWMVSDAPPLALAHVSGVHWLGKVPDSELARLYRSAWVFCLPSTYEGFGIPYVEALASGTPIVATGNAGACEVLADGAWGRIASDEELGNILVTLLNDQETRQHMGTSGLERAAIFSFDRVAAEYEDAYQLATQKHQGWRR